METTKSTKPFLVLLFPESGQPHVEGTGGGDAPFPTVFEALAYAQGAVERQNFSGHLYERFEVVEVKQRGVRAGLPVCATPFCGRPAKSYVDHPEKRYTYEQCPRCAADMVRRNPLYVSRPIEARSA